MTRTAAALLKQRDILMAQRERHCEAVQRLQGQPHSEAHKRAQARAYGATHDILQLRQARKERQAIGRAAQ